MAIVGCLAATASSLPAAAQSRPAATWAADPARAGRDSPPVGRSLFDFVVAREADGTPAYDVPFPFERLVKHIEARAGCKPPCAKQVLIPLGRSLQRTAAAPAFFEFPRVVVAIDAEPAQAGALLARDRIYLGYQEKNDLVEVISYNEAAGRFEFQVVRDYRESGAREVVYARRAMCAACHQNLAPIFSRQVWEETNSNPRIAALLGRPPGKAGGDRADYQGVPIHRGIDVPNAIDAATDRANLLGVWQLLWRAGCGDGETGAKCRAAALVAALQYRLTDERAFDERSAQWREAFLPTFARTWRARWPDGLAIPNPDIPNRDPLPPEGGRRVAGLAATHVPAVFEPLAPRAPLEVWTLADLPPLARASVPPAFERGRAFRADSWPAWRRSSPLPTSARSTLGSPHAPDADAPPHGSTRRRARSPGPTRVRGSGALAQAMRRFASPDASSCAMRALPVATSGRSRWRGAAPRASRGHRRFVRCRRRPGDVRHRRPRVARATRRRRGDQRHHARLEAVRSARAWRASGSLRARNRCRGRRLRAGTRRRRRARCRGRDDAALAARPFGRVRVLAPLFAQLGIPARDWCCEDASRLPPAVVEAPEPPIPATGAATPFAAFYPLCASCHATAERFPPNFLAGPPERVAASMRQCAPRIYARLAMWRVAPATRDKTPMPPPLPSARGDAYEPSPAIAGLERTAADLVRAESGAPPQLETLLASGYERLRPCLPA